MNDWDNMKIKLKNCKLCLKISNKKRKLLVNKMNQKRKMNLMKWRTVQVKSQWKKILI